MMSSMSRTLTQVDAARDRIAAWAPGCMPSYVLEPIVRDRNWMVRALAAAHEGLTEDQALLLARDPVWEVRWRLVNNPSVPPPALKAVLAHETDAPLRSAASRGLATRVAAAPPAPPPAEPAPDEAGRSLTFFDQEKVRPAVAKDLGRKAWFDRLEKRGTTRSIPTVDQVGTSALNALLHTAPHLACATSYVLRQIAAAGRRRTRTLSMSPLLLVGPPAAGKTWWAERIADALGWPSAVIDMPSVTCSWELSGGSASWDNSQPGRIVRTFLNSDCASPVLILDEIDKVKTNQFDPCSVLLSLLEPDSAARWHDEFFDTQFDVSHAHVIATANYLERIDPALLSRFHVIDVRVPRREEMPAIVRSVWWGFRERQDVPGLPACLDERTVDQLSTAFEDARALLRVFEHAVGQASLRPGEIALTSDDFSIEPARRPAPFGFIPQP
jgi:ATP-dependent Lon protease